ncbi:uncharacterized protein PHALS_12498 [Plasmopara halstedii]|uniref:Uncharacterized protein n=1 Tax=Plasmopara halstedii TaxID=4781 RepID=A0A0P1AM11_PLAHL|nr:uncharacterized protein PHALS_12498 [Plasmopara halstedii]CEG42204.1 hypothetical protein PHALS_12498 [Plasmopara halstedii]|eukprot:XP_024578573.1 hypothetical protein PHALS_12498 [Plasmopara halstedii]
MVGNVAYVQLSGPSSSATLGIYAGMSPQELKQLVRAALSHNDGVCAGFLVAQEDVNRRLCRKKCHFNSNQRLIPLSLACKAPELLTGRVTALFAPPKAHQRLKESENAAEASNDLNRLHRLLQGLESEQNFSKFETAMLYDLCEQQSAYILDIMSRNTSVDQKKRFLLRLLHPDNSCELRNEFNYLRKTAQNDPSENLLQTELIAQKIAAIGSKVSSHEFQLQMEGISQENWCIDSDQVGDTMKLLSLVEKLLDKHVLPEENGVYLLKLVLYQNPVLWSAFYRYKNGGCSLLDLETTAKRLAAMESIPPKPVSTSKSKKSPNVTKMNNHLIVVVESLYEQRMLTGLELEILLALLAQHDSQVQQIIRDFQSSEDQDFGALRDSLVGVVKELTMELGDEEKAPLTFAFGSDDALREADELPEDSDINDNDMQGWQRHLTFLVKQWQACNELTDVAAQTLQNMLMQRHNLLESAYEVFATDADAYELLDTLQRVAKMQHQIEQTGQKVSDSAAQRELSLEDVVKRMQLQGLILSEDASGLLGLLYGGNEALQAANEAFQADNDVHELEETLMLVVKHARFNRNLQKNKVVDEVEHGSCLLAELGRSGRLNLWQIQVLISLLKRDDPRLLAAMDLHDEDKNLEELIETLSILAHLASREQHVHDMVYAWITSFNRDDILTQTQAKRLIELVEVRDHRLFSAFVMFLNDDNKDEFVSSLRRIANLNLQEEWTEDNAVLALLKDCEEQLFLSHEEREQVEALMCNGETRLLAAIDVLAETKDTEDFADTARRILAKLKEENEMAKFSLKDLSNSSEIVREKNVALDQNVKDEAKDEVANCSVVAECDSCQDKQELQEEMDNTDDQVADVVMAGN